jgi:hypothetical protein
MEHHPAVIVHSFGEAVASLREAQAIGRGVTLLSAPGAALYAGCGWWRALVEAARAKYPDVPCADMLDCADGTGQALAALRIGLTRLVLWPDAPGREAVVAIAQTLGGFVLPAPPPAVAFMRTSYRPAETKSVPENEASGTGDKTPLPG